MDIEVVCAHPLSIAARRVASEVLAPAAEVVDGMDLLPRSHLESLAAGGLMGLVAPVDQGGADAAGPVVRHVQRVVAGACGATFFTWVQHHAPVRYLASAPDSPARRRWLPELATGRAWGGVGFAYLRRPGPPVVRAERCDGGWIFDGVAPWVTGWGLVDVIVVVAGAPDGSKVFAALTPDMAGLEATPLDLMVLGSTGTVRMTLDGVRVGADELIDIWSAARWAAVDRDAAARPGGAPCGIASTALEHLTPMVPDVAGALRTELTTLCADAEDLLGTVDPPDRSGWQAALTQVRDRSLSLAGRATQAYVVAAGGRAMDRSHPAQRLLREAAFHLIQAQTPMLRAQSLSRLSAADR
ncbi:MAG: hypothetical protein NVS3B21_03740 [Acidimicrobiales bacterium]